MTEPTTTGERRDPKQIAVEGAKKLWAYFKAKRSNAKLLAAAAATAASLVATAVGANALVNAVQTNNAQNDRITAAEQAIDSLGESVSSVVEQIDGLGGQLAEQAEQIAAIIESSGQAADDIAEVGRRLSELAAQGEFDQEAVNAAIDDLYGELSMLASALDSQGATATAASVRDLADLLAVVDVQNDTELAGVAEDVAALGENTSTALDLIAAVNNAQNAQLADLVKAAEAAQTAADAAATDAAVAQAAADAARAAADDAQTDADAAAADLEEAIAVADQLRADFDAAQAANDVDLADILTRLAAAEADVDAATTAAATAQATADAAAAAVQSAQLTADLALNVAGAASNQATQAADAASAAAADAADALAAVDALTNGGTEEPPATGFEDVGGLRLMWGELSGDADDIDTPGFGNQFRIPFPAAFADTSYSVSGHVNSSGHECAVQIARATSPSYVDIFQCDFSRGPTTITWTAVGPRP